MSALSNYLENALLNHVLRGASYTPPSNIYVSLHTADVTDNGTGIEVTGGGYSRKPISFALASAGSITNNATVLFDEATTDWGTITHIAFWDASSGGNLLFHGPLASPKTISTGDQLKIGAGIITITLD